MLPDRVSNPEPLTYESGALPIALHGPARKLLYRRNTVVAVLLLYVHGKQLSSCWDCQLT